MRRPASPSAIRRGWRWISRTPTASSRKNLIELANGDVHSVNVVQATGRSRVVLNLKRPLSFQSTIEGNALVVSLDQAVGAAALGRGRARGLQLRQG